ncbi:translation initiation factor 2 [Actinoplanes sp. NPDC049548]|uniref:translation initiation factor 2 n=1 Tax=Actinoplanes sp. NPDC049548 TaxID=3155152 RepID=UPI003434A9C8
MPDQHSQPLPDAFGPLQGGERALWRGRCAVAEYAFDRAASLPRWTLPETTEVLVTDRRLGYAYTSSESPDDLEITSGELRWLYPQHVRVQPGSRTPGRAAAVTQIQLVCGGADGSFPALVLAGGELAEVGDADRLANVIRHAIARFRMDNADKLGLSIPQARMLSRLLIGPEFTNFQGGEGQTVSLLGALPVPRQEPGAYEPEAILVESATASEPTAGRPPAHRAGHAEVAAWRSDPATHEPSRHDVSAAWRPDPAAHDAFVAYGADGGDAGAAASVSSGDGIGRLPGYRPGLAADEARALQAAAAEEATQRAEPDLASRAADLASRVAHLVAGDAEPDRSNEPTTDLTARAERVRRASARFAANSGRGKAAARRPDQELGATTRGNRNR